MTVKRMSYTTKVLITGLVVVTFDVIASLVSRTFQIEYGYFILVSLILYVLIGFWGAWRRSFVYGMLLGAIAGLSDSTLGWFASRMIGPYIQPKVPHANFSLVVITVLMVTILALACGSVGSLFCVLLRQTRPADA